MSFNNWSIRRTFLPVLTLQIVVGSVTIAVLLLVAVLIATGFVLARSQRCRRRRRGEPFGLVGKEFETGRSMDWTDLFASSETMGARVSIVRGPLSETVSILQSQLS